MVAVSPDQRRAYLTNVSTGTISVIDIKEGRKLKDLAVGGYPEGIAVTNDGTQLWVGDNTTPRVRVIDADSGAQIAEMPTDPIAIRVAISPDGKTAVTSNMASGTLSVFDVATRRPLRTIKVSGERAALQVTIAFSRDGRRLFVAETGRDKIAEVDMGSGAVLRRLDAGKYGDGLAVAP
jgi:YVTN family beta-propeller protein